MNAIDNLFSDHGGQRLTLCTIHKSKGMEWNRVFILDCHLMPSRYARKGWQKVQETNLIYVAHTRAKTELYFINSDSFSD